MKQLLFVFFLMCSATVFAQDVIVKKDGSTIICRVVELTSSEIVYKKWSDLGGPNYVMDRSLVSAINYQNGKKVNLSESTNLYMPNNQNNGAQQYNDKALLNIDYVSSNPYRSVKTLKTIAWIGGAAFVAASVPFFWLCSNDGSTLFNDTNGITGVACVGAGAIWTTSFLFAAKNKKKKIDQRLSNITLMQLDIDIKNGSTITPSVGLLCDRVINKHTLALGLSYNF